MHMNVYMPVCVHACMYVYINLHALSSVSTAHSSMYVLHACIYAHMYVHAYACTYVYYTQTHTHTHTHTHVMTASVPTDMHVQAHACMRTYLELQLKRLPSRLCCVYIVNKKILL
jgi:hypothetical protein